MPVPPFEGNTFVAFTDIAGFKAMMSDTKRAQAALSVFYQTGYRVLQEQLNNATPVNGFFISDSGVLFVRGEQEDAATRLESLCGVLRQIHQRTFENAIQLTTSIAWGEFSYHDRIEFPGIEKNPVYGSAYVAAFIDNENGSPKLYPSECRLNRDNLPPEITAFCTQRIGPVARRMREEPHHFYYEWMRQYEDNV